MNYRLRIKIRTKVLSLKKNDIYKTCKDNLLDCPWFFRCDSNKYELVPVENVCDFKYDCKDQSDEKYCSNATHFNCTTRGPVSTNRSKINDNELDCADVSDECKESSISSLKEMIKDDRLRNFVWVFSFGTIVFNLFVIIKNLTKIKELVDTKSTKFYHLLFILNLSLSDVIFCFVLGAVAFKSSIYSGVYCAKDFEWRSSLSCNIIGVLILISSQTSLNILVLTIGFRLYTVYRPYKSLDIKKQKVYFLLFICWAFSLALSFTTIFLEKYFTQKMIISSNIFLRNRKVHRIIKSNDFHTLAENIENVWTFSRPDSIPWSKSIHNVLNFQDWYFSSDEAVE